MLIEEVKDVKALCRWIRTNPQGMFGVSPCNEAKQADGRSGVVNIHAPAKAATSSIAAAATNNHSGAATADGSCAVPSPPSGHRIVIVGDSAGAPVAGSALDEEGVVG